MLPTCRETHFKPYRIRTPEEAPWKRFNFMNTDDFPRSTVFGYESFRGKSLGIPTCRENRSLHGHKNERRPMKAIPTTILRVLRALGGGKSHPAFCCTISFFLISLSIQATPDSHEATPNPASLSPELVTLQAFGDAHLESEEWRILWNRRQSFLSFLETLNKTLQEKRLINLPAKDPSGQPIKLDPWGALDQENSFRPNLGRLRFWTGHPAGTAVPKAAIKAIPPQYRLAEAMGLGSNKMVLEPSIEDGQLFTSTIYGFHIAHRVRFALIGTFLPNQETSAIRTLYQSILSRERINTQEVHLGPDVKPHQIALSRRLLRDYSKDHLQTIWNLEHLDLKYPDHFDSVMLPPEIHKQQAPLETALEQSMLAQFRSWQSEVSQLQWEHLQKKGDLNILDRFQQQFMNWESTHAKETECPLRLKAGQLPTSVSLKSWLEQQTNEEQSWSLTPTRRAHIEGILNASIAHGLYHRVPRQVQEEALRHYLVMMEEAAWGN